MNGDGKANLFTDAGSLAVLAALICGLALMVWAFDRAYLPRHPAAHDLPWAQTDAAQQTADEPNNRSLNDKVNLIYPDYAFTLREFRAGRLPLWNPDILCGTPHAANPMTGVFYPLNWLLIPFDPMDACLVAAALHVLLAAAGMYLFLRVAGLNPLAALLGAFGFGFCGWMAGHLHNTPLAAVVSWIPVGLAGVEAVLKERRGLWAGLVSLSIAMMWLAGFPQFAVLGCVVLGLYAAIGLISRLFWRGALLLGAAALIGGLLAGIQLAPSLELLDHAANQGDRTAGDLVNERYRTGAWIGLVLPTTLGDPMQPGDWWEQLSARLLLGDKPALFMPKVTNWSERTLYPGIILLILAVMGCIQLGSRVVWTLLILIIAALALACCPPVILLLSRVPGFDFGAPARAVLILAVCLPPLAAFGMQRLVGSPRQQWLLARILASLSVAGGSLAVFFVLGDELCIDWMAPWASSDEVMTALMALRLDLFRLTAVCLLGWLMLTVVRGSPPRPRMVSVVVIFMVSADLLAFFIPVNLPVTKDRLFEVTPGLRVLEGQRFARVSERAGAAVEDVHRLLPSNMGSPFGLADAQGYREQALRNYLQLWHGTAAWILPVGISGIAADQADSSILDLAGVRHLIAARPVASLEARQVYPESGQPHAELWIYENPDPLPRAFVVHSARTVSDEDALEEIREGRVDLRNEVLLAEFHERGDPVASLGAEVWIEEDLPGKLAYRVKSHAPGFLVVTDTWYPGWEALVEPSGEAPVLRANVCFRAVPIDAGEQVVTLAFQPVSVKIGLALSVSGLLALALMLLTQAKSRK